MSIPAAKIDHTDDTADASAVRLEYEIPKWLRYSIGSFTVFLGVIALAATGTSFEKFAYTFSLLFVAIVYLFNAAYLAIEKRTPKQAYLSLAYSLFLLSLGILAYIKYY